MWRRGKKQTGMPVVIASRGQWVIRATWQRREECHWATPAGHSSSMIWIVIRHRKSSTLNAPPLVNFVNFSFPSLSLSLFSRRPTFPSLFFSRELFHLARIGSYSAINFFPEISILLETEKVKRKEKEKKKRAARRKCSSVASFYKLSVCIKKCVLAIFFTSKNSISNY